MNCPLIALLFKLIILNTSLLDLIPIFYFNDQVRLHIMLHIYASLLDAN